MSAHAKIILSSSPSFMPAHTKLLQRKCVCGGAPGIDGECAECRRKRLSLQQSGRMATASSTVTVQPIVRDVLRSPGQPLDADTRTFMEPRFGHDFSQVQIDRTTPLMTKTDLTISQPGDQGEQEADRMAEQVMRGSKHAQSYDFSQVRIHTDTQAAESARAINAVAYTVGRHIVFGSGQYAPGTTAGQRLLAHELTHVVQQTGRDHNGGTAKIQRFTTDEHKLIGDLAAKEAGKGFTPAMIKQSPLGDILRKGSRFPMGKQVKTYGDIVADPDYFALFEDLIKAEGDRPGRLGVGVLAARNIQHFTPDNVKYWKELHDFAVEQMFFAHNQLAFVIEILHGLDPILEAARAAMLKDDTEAASKLLTEYRRRFEPLRGRLEPLSKNARDLAKQALMRNAFADHFLSDAFAAGHIVAPRKEILQEAGTRLEEPETAGHIIRAGILGATWGELGQIRAQARSLAWHDLDNYYGVEVKDATNRTWTACGDHCSERTGDIHWKETREHVIAATAESIKHLWMAGLNGERPKDYRSVLNLVPRPTWKNYPAWEATDWENQLRHIRGENVPHKTGDNLTPFAVDLFPIEHCRSLELNCWRPYIGTSKDWIKKYSFQAWVRPWIAKIQAQAASRYNF